MNRSTLSDVIGDCHELGPIIIELLLPKRRHRNRRYAGRKPIPDRPVMKGILFKNNDNGGVCAEPTKSLASC